MLCILVTTHMVFWAVFGLKSPPHVSCWYWTIVVWFPLFPTQSPHPEKWEEWWFALHMENVNGHARMIHLWAETSFVITPNEKIDKVKLITYETITMPRRTALLHKGFLLQFHLNYYYCLVASIFESCNETNMFQHWRSYDFAGYNYAAF